MKKLTPLFLKLLDYKVNYTDYLELKEKYETGKITLEEKDKLFNKIGTIELYYVRLLKEEYKGKNIYLTCPIDVLTQAQKDGIINDGEFWISYLHVRDAYNQTNDIEKKNEIVNKTVGYYSDMVPSMNQYVNKLKPIWDDLCEVWKYHSKIEHPILDESPAVYSPTILNITEYSYNILINYLKSKPLIKNVWFHGSRFLNTATKSSDIDLIIDCPALEFEQIKKEINNLTIPYIIDCKCYNEPRHLFFIQNVMATGCKKLYCANDWQIYWGNNNNTNKNLIVNLSNII